MIFLLSFEYSVNSSSTSSIITKLLLTSLSFLMSLHLSSLMLKIRIFQFAIK